MNDSSRPANSAPALHGRLIQELAAWEHEQGLFDYRLGGIPLWRLIRSDQISAFLNRAGVRGLDNYNRPRLGGLMRFLGGVGLSLVHTLRLRRYRHLVIGFARRRLDGGVWVDTFFDPLIDLLGHDDTLCIERPFVGQRFRPARTQHVMYYDWVKAVATLSGRIFFWIVALRADASLEALARVVADRVGAPTKSIRHSLCIAYTKFGVELDARDLSSIE